MWGCIRRATLRGDVIAASRGAVRCATARRVQSSPGDVGAAALSGVKTLTFGMPIAQEAWATVGGRNRIRLRHDIHVKGVVPEVHSAAAVGGSPAVGRLKFGSQVAQRRAAVRSGIGAAVAFVECYVHAPPVPTPSGDTPRRSFQFVIGESFEDTVVAEILEDGTVVSFSLPEHRRDFAVLGVERVEIAENGGAMTHQNQRLALSSTTVNEGALVVDCAAILDGKRSATKLRGGEAQLIAAAVTKALTAALGGRSDAPQRVSEARAAASVDLHDLFPSHLNGDTLRGDPVGTALLSWYVLFTLSDSANVHHQLPALCRYLWPRSLATTAATGRAAVQLAFHGAWHRLESFVGAGGVDALRRAFAQRLASAATSAALRQDRQWSDSETSGNLTATKRTGWVIDVLRQLAELHSGGTGGREVDASQSMNCSAATVSSSFVVPFQRKEFKRLNHLGIQVDRYHRSRRARLSGRAFDYAQEFSAKPADARLAVACVYELWGDLVRCFASSGSDLTDVLGTVTVEGSLANGLTIVFNRDSAAASLLDPQRLLLSELPPTLPLPAMASYGHAMVDPVNHDCFRRGAGVSQASRTEAATVSALTTSQPNAVDRPSPQQSFVMELPLSTIDVVLRRYGLPHDIVVHHLLNYLNHRTLALHGRTGSREPMVLPRLSVSSVLASNAIVQQRIRVHDVYAPLLRELANGLRSGSAWRESVCADNGSRRARAAADKFVKVDAIQRAKRLWQARRMALAPQKQRRRDRRTDQRSVGIHTAPSITTTASGGSTAVVESTTDPATLALLSRHRYELRVVAPAASSSDSRVAQQSHGEANDPRDADHNRDDTQRRLLSPQDLWGFRYRIVLRRVLAEEQQLATTALSQLQNDGFVNYFGMEHFQRRTFRNVHVGLFLLMGKFRAAAHALVDGVGSTDDDNYSFAAGVGDGAGGEDALSGAKASIVAALRDSIDQGTSDATCAAVLRQELGEAGIRKHVREFCAFVWNSTATQRIKRYGARRVLAGDLVILPEKASMGDTSNDRPRVDPPSNVDTTAATQLTADDRRVSVDHTGSADGADRGARGRRLHWVTDDDIAAGRFTAHDVVLPIPGADVALPHNGTADILIHTLQHYGIALNPETDTWPLFEGATSDDDNGAGGGNTDIVAAAAAVEAGNAVRMRFKGGYRRLLERPVNFTWELQKNDEASGDGATAEDRTSCERKMRRAVGGQTHRRGAAGALPWAPRPTMSLVVSFDLGASAFPSSLLRELGKRNQLSLPVSALAASVNRSQPAAAVGSQAPPRPTRRAEHRHVSRQLHQARLEAAVFRSQGLRRSFIPTMRSMDSVT